MSYTVDVNLLLYASDRSSPQHTSALAFLESRASDSELFCLAWPTLMSYLRIATHPRIFAEPLSPAEAVANLQTLLDLPHTRTICEEDGFLDVYRQATGHLAVRGNLVPDAHLAALLRQHGVRRIYSTDTDFKKFDFLEVRNPLD